MFTDGEVRWKYQITSNSRSSSLSSPAIANDGTIYIVGSCDNSDGYRTYRTSSLYAINPDATLKWQYSVNNNANFYSPAIGSDGTIYCAANNNYLYAVFPNGVLRWQYQLNGQMSGGGVSGIIDIGVPPAIGTDNTVYLTTWTGSSYLYAIHANGGLKWQQQISFSYVSSPVAIANDGTIYVADMSMIHAINPNGTLKWQYSNSSYYRGTSLPMAIGNNGTVYLVRCGDLNGVLAIDSNGNLAWQFATGCSYSAPVVSDSGMIYADGAYLYPNGTPMWQSSLANSPVVHSSAIGSDGTIYYYNYYYNCLNAVYTNGGLRWSYNFDNSGSTSNPTSFSPVISSDGTIYFGANDGNLYAFNTKNSVNTSPWPQFQQNAQHTGVQTTQQLQVFDLRYLTLKGTHNILKSLKLEMIQQNLLISIITTDAIPTTITTTLTATRSFSNTLTRSITDTNTYTKSNSKTHSATKSKTLTLSDTATNTDSSIIIPTFILTNSATRTNSKSVTNSASVTPTIKKNIPTPKITTKTTTPSASSAYSFTDTLTSSITNTRVNKENLMRISKTLTPTVTYSSTKSTIFTIAKMKIITATISITHSLTKTPIAILNSNSAISVINPIPMQLVSITTDYKYVINISKIFSGNIQFFSVTLVTDNIVFPTWINLANYNVTVLESLQGTAQKIVISGNYAYIACSNQWLQIIDVSNSLNPKITASYSSEQLQNTNINDVAVSGNYVYIATAQNVVNFSPSSIQILYMSSTGPIFQSSYTTTQLSDYLCPHGTSSNICFSGGGGSKIYGSIYSIAILNNFAYTLYATGLQVFDISNPSSIVPRGSYFTSAIGEACTYSITIYEQLLYVTTSAIGLKIFDISFPGTLNHIGSYAGNELNVYDNIAVCVHKNIAYVNTARYLYMFDVSNPSTPTLIKTCSNADPELGSNSRNTINNVFVSGNLAYISISGASNGMLLQDKTVYPSVQILDIQNSLGPKLVGSYYSTVSSACTRIITVNNLAYITLNDEYASSSLQIINLIAPRELTISSDNTMLGQQGSLVITAYSNTGNKMSTVFPFTIIDINSMSSNHKTPTAIPHIVHTKTTTPSTSSTHSFSDTLTRSRSVTNTYTNKTDLMRSSRLINVSIDLMKLAGASDIHSLAIKYSQALAQSDLKLYPKLVGNYAIGQTIEIFQLVASNVNKVTETFSNGIQLANETVLTSNLFTEGLLKWKYRTSYPINSSPAIGKNGIIYLVDNHYLYAVDPNGNFLWNYTTSLPITSSPAISSNGIIYIGSYDSYLHAINPDGSQKWQCNIGSITISSPAIANDNTIYIGSSDFALYAIDLNGSLKWRYQTGNSISASAAIADDGIIYAGSLDSYLYAIYPDGKLKWKYYVFLGAFTSSPAIAHDGTIYIGGCDNYLYAIDSNGILKWRYQTGDWVESSPVIANDGTVYVGSNDHYLYAVNSNGNLKWRYQTNYAIKSSPAIDNDGTIYFGSNDRYLYAINFDGILRWKYNFLCSYNQSPSPVISSNGTIYVGTNCNYLYAISSKSFSDVSPWPQFRQNNLHNGIQPIPASMQLFDLRYLTLQGTSKIIKLLKIEMINQDLLITIMNQDSTLNIITPGKPFSITLSTNELFSNNNSMLSLSCNLKNGEALPSWLKLAMTPQLSSNYLNVNTNSIKIVAKTAYLADDNGLKIIDLNNLSDPKLIATYTTLTAASNIAVLNNVIYLATGMSGLQIINIDIPTQPTLVRNYTTINVNDVTVTDSLVLAAGTTGLHIFNKVTNQLLGNYLTSNPITSIYINGNTIFTATGSSGLHIIDINNPGQPVLITSYTATQFVNSVTVFNNMALITDLNLGLQIIDISDLNNLRMVGQYSNLNAAKYVITSGTMAFITDHNGLQIIDLSSIVKPSLLGSYQSLVGSYTATQKFKYLRGKWSTQDINQTANIFSQIAIVDSKVIAVGTMGLQTIDCSKWSISGMPPNNIANYTLLLKGTDPYGKTFINYLAIYVNNSEEIMQSNSSNPQSLLPTTSSNHEKLYIGVAAAGGGVLVAAAAALILYCYRKNHSKGISQISPERSQDEEDARRLPLTEINRIGNSRDILNNRDPRINPHDGSEESSDRILAAISSQTSTSPDPFILFSHSTLDGARLYPHYEDAVRQPSSSVDVNFRSNDAHQAPRARMAV